MGTFGKDASKNQVILVSCEFQKVPFRAV